MLSTIKEVFNGNKELFKNLFIYDKIEWKNHPVIHFDLSNTSFRSTEDIFKRSIIAELSRIGKRYNVEIESPVDHLEAFVQLIEKLSNINKVVILVDEYDKPIVEFIADIEKAKRNREILKDFYSVIKSNDQNIKFCFITGVSKFSKVSIFSGLNNIKDISLNPDYATICGYTEEELYTDFADNIKFVAEYMSVTEEQLKVDIKNWYNGYSWDGKTSVYNPYSILSFFQDKKFSTYWFSTGTPTFLIDKFKNDKLNPQDITNIEVFDAFFEKFEIEDFDFHLLLFQTGYLTIKNHDCEVDTYLLDYPNNEVRNSFIIHLSTVYLGGSANDSAIFIMKVNAYLKKQDYNKFFDAIKSIFKSIPYSINNDNEAYYHSIFYVIMMLMGAKIDVEKMTINGRIDGVIEYDDVIYIIEMKHLKDESKVAETLEKAITQIQNKEYYAPYLAKNKAIKYIAIAINKNNVEFKIS